jgi:hypothetical protein
MARLEDDPDFQEIDRQIKEIDEIIKSIRKLNKLIDDIDTMPVRRPHVSDRGNGVKPDASSKNGELGE